MSCILIVFMQETNIPAAGIVQSGHIELSLLSQLGILAVAVAITAVSVWYWTTLRLKRQNNLPQSSDSNESYSKLGEFGRLYLGMDNIMLIDNLPIYVYAEDIDNEFRHVVVNKKCEELWGRPREEILGKSDYELFGNTSEVNEFRRTDLEAAKSNVMLESILPVTGANGETRICQFFRKRLDLSGNRHWLFGMVIDITEQKTLLDNQTVLNQCFDEIMGRSLAEDNTILILKSLCQQLKGNRCCLFQYQYASGHVLPITEYLADNAQPLLSRFEKRIKVDFNSPRYEKIKQGEIIGGSGNNAPIPQELMNFYLEDYRNNRVKSVYTAGIIVSGKIWGEFGIVYEVNPHQLTETEKGFFQSVAHLLGLLLERRLEHQQLEAAKENNQVWELLSNAVSFFFFVKDMSNDGKYIVCNQAFAQAMGITRSEIIGKSDFDFFPFDEAMTLRKHDLEILHHPQGKENEEKLTEPSSRETHYYLSSKRSYISANGHNLLLCSASDITELRNIRQREQAGTNALMEMVNETDFNKSLDKIAHVIMSNMKADRIMLVQKKEDGKTQLYEEWISPGTVSYKNYIATLESFWNARTDQRKNNLIIMISDIQSDPDHEFLRKNIPDYRTRSCIITPIQIRDEFWGFLVISYEKVQQKFSFSDENIARLMTNIIATVFLRQRMAEKLQVAEYQSSMVLDNIHIPLWLFDGHGKLIRANNEVGKLISHNFDVSAISEDQDIIPHLQNGIEPSVLEVLNTHTTVRHETVWNEQRYDINVEPVFDIAGELAYIVKSAVDVTELNAMIEYQKIVNFCMEAFFKEEDSELAVKRVLGAICRYMKASRLFIVRFDLENNLAIPYYEYDQKGLPTLFDTPLHFDPNEKWFQTFMAGKQILISDTTAPEYHGFYGTWQPLFEKHNVRSLYFASLFLEGQLFADFGVMYQDVNHEMSEYEKRFLDTEAKLLELLFLRQRHKKRLMDAIEQAQAAAKAKSMFLASMSHEIRTPLNAVIGISELMKDNTLSPEVQQEYLEGISSSGNALLALINDVLDLSKLEAGQMPFNNSEVDFIELLQEMKSVFRQKCEVRNLDFIIDVPDDLPIFMTDKLRLRQILFNLIGNATKFTDVGSITVKVRFTATSDHIGDLIFCVIDTGIGISPENQKKLFQMFYQVERQNQHHSSNNGTGLGLTLVQRLLENMHGHISLESQLQKGSKFTVELPNISFTDRKHKTILPTIENTHTIFLSSLPVLLVDDVPMNLKVMAALLKKFGMSPVTANDPNEALALLEKQNFDILFTDLWMPGMNGAELAWTIRRSGKYPHLKIVAISADVDCGANFDMSAFDEIMSKPVSLEKFRNILQKMIPS